MQREKEDVVPDTQHKFNSIHDSQRNVFEKGKGEMSGRKKGQKTGGGWLGSPPWRGSQELLGVLLCVVTYRLHAHDGLLHLGDVCDVVLIGFELLLLDPFIDAYHQLSGDVSTIIHTYQCGGVRASDKKDTIALHTGAPGRWP